ncbi:MAG: AAA family ATPase [Coriobacteriia bacterium]|nr:AAA family ATPase [Coriobacteriia bacterium]
MDPVRLRSAEAVRYGALEGARLEVPGDGLTVVLGPNESGKSTLAALVRHVLYGFPDRREKERSYSPSAGSRHGRLVFESAGGEWAIERFEGKDRGLVKVVARRGSERPGLLGEITGGVSKEEYRVVFGFGLDELAEIESGGSEDVVGRLYAATTGLAVNPVDIRSKLAVEAESLYKQRGKNQEINRLASRLSEVRKRIRELERDAAVASGEQDRLERLRAQAARLKEERDALGGRLGLLGRLQERAADRAEQLTRLADELKGAEAEAERVRRKSELLVVDENALAAAPAVQAVLEDASAFRERLAQIASLDEQAAETARRKRAFGRLPADAADSPELRVAVDRWKDRLNDARRDLEHRQQAMRAAEDDLAREEAVVADAPAQKERPDRTILWIGVALAALGAGAALVGALMHQTMAAVFGGVILVFASVCALIGARPHSSNQSSSEETSGKVLRLRADVTSAAQAVQRAKDAQDQAALRWRSWLEEHSLDAFGDDPLAVIGLLEQIRERDGFASEHERIEAAAANGRKIAEAWVLRLVEAAGLVDPAFAQVPELTAALGLAERVRVAVKRAAEVADERKQLAGQLEAAEARHRDLAHQHDALASEAEAIASEYGLAGAAGLSPHEVADELAARAASLAADFDHVRERHEQACRDEASLSARIDEQGRDDALASARQELEGLRVEADEAASRFLVAGLAVRLMDRACERFERERQPEVVMRAAQVFSAMTEGRYSDLRVRIDGKEISAVAHDGAVRSTRELSRGTAEQLYLALRVGLIGSLGGLGRSLPILMDDVVVNFDPARRAEAAAAIAALASERQVLFFTCHPNIAEILYKRVKNSELVQL